VIGSSPFGGSLAHSAVEFQFIKIVALGFIRRVEANATGNVTVKVTRHQRMMIM
jgi:hypothetical protein